MKKNKKTVLKVFLILLISTVIFLLLQHIYVKLMSPKVNLEKSDKGIIVKYTIVDEESSKGYDTIDDIMYKNEDSIIYNSYGFETISKKDSNTYEGTLSNANEMLTNGVVDYAFAKMNTNGEVITDAKYDKKTKKLTIPAKYIEKESIQMQVLVKLSSDKIVNTKVKTKILNGSIKNSTITLNGFDTQSYITLDDYDSNKNIDKSSINVYVNKKYKVVDENYSYDKKSKTIKLTLNPLLANNIEVVIEKQSIAEKMFKTVFAAYVDIEGNPVTSDDADGIKLKTDPSKLTEDSTGEWNLRWAYYNGRIPYYKIDPDDSSSTIAYLNESEKNTSTDKLLKTAKCAERKSTDNPYPNCPERNLVANVIDSARYVMGFPKKFLDSNYKISSTNYEAKAKYTDSDFIITHDYDTVRRENTDRDVEFAIRLDDTLFGSDFVHDDDNSSVLYGDDYFWVAAYCLHINRGTTSATDVKTAKTLNFTYKVLYKRGNIMIMQIMMKTGEVAGGQNAYGVYKFYWEDEPEAKIRVEKKFYDSGNETSISDKSGVRFRIYTSKNDCNATRNSKAYAETDKDGLAKFTSSDGTEKTFKMNTTYYVKETNLGIKFPTNDWTMDTTCTKVKVTKTKNDGTETKDDGTVVYIKKITKTNKKKYYCLKVKKTDAETEQSLPGISFKITPTNAIGVSGADGVVTFLKLTYGKDGKYRITETSNDGTNGYWNDYKNGGNSLDYTLTADDEMNYDSDGKPTSCKSTTQVWHKKDHKQYYCLKVKKVDKISGASLKGATFQTTIDGKTVTKKDSDDGADDGVTTFFLGANPGTYSIIETAAPAGYAKYNGTISANAILLPRELTETEARTECLKANAKDSNGNTIVSNQIKAENSKYLINWYKEAETDGKKAAGAKFIVRYTDNNNDNSSNITYYVKAGSKESQTDASGISKNCYKYTGLTTNESEATKFISDNDGEACISGIIDNGKKKYTVEEVEPAAYHTFDSSNSKQISISTTFAANDANKNNTFRNYQTKFEFTKTVYGVTDYDEETIKQLKKLKFNIKNSEGTVLSFKLVNGIYEYVGNNIDGPSDKNNALEDLTLNNDRQIIVQHLPIGNYTIEEKDNTCSTTDTSCECIGYYYDSTTQPFEIKKDYTTKATTAEMVNYSTKVEFTKKDLYENIKGSTVVKFENDEEVKAFDDIGFKIKKGGQDITNHLVEETPGSGVYRYVSYKTTTEELHTNNGTLTITNLCKNTTYTIVENSVPAHSIFALVNSPSVTFTVDNEKPEFTQKVEISDEPTRMEIEKKDLETKELITTPGATFEVYRCKAGQTCEDTFDKSKTVLVKFYDKETINDETVYRYAANQSSKGLVSSLSLTSGKIIMRYLPAGFRYYVIETKAPDGYYELSGDQKLITFVQLNDNITTKSSPTNKPVSIEFTKDDILKYYNSTDASKAGSDVKIFDSMKFKLHDSEGNVLSLKCVEVDGKKYNSETEMCESGVYRYLPTNKSNIMQEINTINGTFRITHLYNNTKYHIEETKADSEGVFILPTNRHYDNLKFDNKGHPVVTYNVPSTAPAKDNDNSIFQIILNSPTRVVFEKRDFTTNELIDDEQMPAGSTRTTFRIYMCAESVKECTKDNGTLLHFEDRSVVDGDGGLRSYKYSKLNAGKVTDLITDKGKLIIRYLPSNYKYIIYEAIAPAGYYNPDEVTASISFTVKGTSESDREDYESVTEIVKNTPTKLIFNKEDLYRYYNTSDVASASNLTKLFDTMRFRLYNSKGEVLTLKCVEKDGKGYNSKTKMCESGEYRYLPLKEKTEEEEQKVVRTDELNTINGTFEVTHLYRNSVYYIEEIKSDDEGVFILPNYLKYDDIPFINNGHPVVKYQLPDKEPDSYESVTEVIDNIPTRVRLEKRDSKYGYLIDDETTTFNVYSCEKTVSKCTEENGTLVYFSKRAVINGDKEDNGIEVYKYSKKNAKAVSDLHPYHGVLVLRYLPSKYKYVLVETKSPKGYVLPDGENKNTNFEVRSETTDIEEVDVPNKPTSLLIKKYSDDGKLLPGAEFKVYEGTSCDANLSAMNQPKKLLKLKTIRDGLYENRPEQDTDTVLTCTDKEGAKCSDISTNTMTKLTYNDYINSWVNFDDSVDDEGNKVNLQEGEALIQYLEYNHCYIIEETKAPKGYSLPKNDEDRFTMVTINEDPSIKTTKKELINKPTPFTFYKYDEYNNLLDGAEFKLQKLDSNKKYHDITVTKEETENGVYYKADETSDNKIITTKNGKATVYYLEEGQYRIVETKAAPGKELGKNPNVATFFVDSAGNVYGNSIIVNKAKTETITFTSSASAEFLIWNRTGQTVIKYGLIISSIVAVIVALMVVLRIKKKSD